MNPGIQREEKYYACKKRPEYCSSSNWSRKSTKVERPGLECLVSICCYTQKDRDCVGGVTANHRYTRVTCLSIIRVTVKVQTQLLMKVLSHSTPTPPRWPKGKVRARQRRQASVCEDEFASTILILEGRYPLLAQTSLGMHLLLVPHH